MQIEIKKLHKDSVLPVQATEGSAGLDVFMPVGLYLSPGDECVISIGVAIYIKDPNVVGIILPRSSFGSKGLQLANTAGVIDSDYQGEIKLAMKNNGKDRISWEKGARVVQLILMPKINAQLIEVEEFSESTYRGDGGFGSTGA